MWLNATQMIIKLAIKIKVNYVITLDQMIKLGAILTIQAHKYVPHMMELIATNLLPDGIWL